MVENLFSGCKKEDGGIMILMIIIISVSTLLIGVSFKNTVHQKNSQEQFKSYLQRDYLIEGTITKALSNFENKDFSSRTVLLNKEENISYQYSFDLEDRKVEFETTLNQTEDFYNFPLTNYYDNNTIDSIIYGNITIVFENVGEQDIWIAGDYDNETRRHYYIDTNPFDIFYNNLSKGDSIEFALLYDYDWLKWDLSNWSIQNSTSNETNVDVEIIRDGENQNNISIKNIRQSSDLTIYINGNSEIITVVSELIPHVF